jgi:antitoxin HicB
MSFILKPTEATVVGSIAASNPFTAPQMDYLRSATNTLGNMLSCLVYLMPEDDGGYSVVAALLPGAASQGDTEQEALANIAEAIRGLTQSYVDSGKVIPWADTARPRPSNTKERWVLVHG